jgi:hypothetical protein
MMGVAAKEALIRMREWQRIIANSWCEWNQLN